MRAVITGGAGFIGATVARVLAAGGHAVEIAGTSVELDPLTPARIAALGTFDLAVHCAGGSSVAASVRDPDGDHAKTVPPFAALLAHVRAHSPAARIVLLSSAAVYGHAQQLPTPEDCPRAPVSPYGRHKLACEELCATFGHDGVATAIVRLFSVYGAGLRKQLLWDACHKAQRGDITFAGTGEEQRDWLHVDDAARLIAEVAGHASTEAPAFNGGTGTGVRVRDIVGDICRAFGAGEPQFTGEVRAGDPPAYIADVTRAHALGWAPQTELARGIADYVAWFRTQA